MLVLPEVFEEPMMVKGERRVLWTGGALGRPGWGREARPETLLSLLGRLLAGRSRRVVDALW